MLDDISIVAGWQAGVLGDIISLHGRYYALRWNFGPYFEAKVASELADFVRSRHLHPSQLWCVVDSMDRVLGSIVVDGSHGLDNGAHLRWFILDQRCQGLGLGSKLMDAALEFCRQQGFRRIYLWTFAGLHDARRLYESRGFVLVQELPGKTWGVSVTEQRFELVL